MNNLKSNIIKSVIQIFFVFIILFLTTICFVYGKEKLKIETIDVSPFGMMGTDGKPTGMMYEISNKIAETAGFSYSNELIPYARTITNLSSGTFDFVLRFPNEEITKVAIQVVSVVTMPSIIIAKKNKGFTSIQDLHGKTVGRLRGGKFDDEFDKNMEIIKYEANDYDQILKMLMMDRLDAAIGSNIGIYYTANKNGIKPSQLSKPLLLSNKSFILHLSKIKANDKISTALKAAVEKLKNDGTITKIINKYMGSYDWELKAFFESK